jgi:multisubunit Na+/H+ antiporter MnhE subunit
MTATLPRAAGLLAIYLLVLTSVAPGDVLVGGLLAIAVAVSLRSRGARPATPAPRARLRAMIAVLAGTAAEMARGSGRVVRFCLGGPVRPGLVEIPRDGRSGHNVGLWGVLTGEAPDEVVVDVDERRGVLIVHLVDAGDPDAVRARHRAAADLQRKVVP